MARDSIDEYDNTLVTDPVEKARRWNEIGKQEQAKAESSREGVAVEVDGVVAVASEANQDDEFVVMDDCPDEYDLGQ